MGKLRQMAPRLTALPPRIARATDAHGHNDAVEPWRAWYKTARWRRLRWSILVRDGFTCQCGCARLVGDTSQLVADHTIPHRGDDALFWDPNNLKAWSKPCHDRLKQTIERRAGQGGAV